MELLLTLLISIIVLMALIDYIGLMFTRQNTDTKYINNKQNILYKLSYIDRLVYDGYTFDLTDNILVFSKDGKNFSVKANFCDYVQVVGNTLVMEIGGKTICLTSK